MGRHQQDRPSAQLAERIRTAADGRIVVLLDGHAGSGKTTLADELAYALGAQHVSMDAFYPGWGGLEVGSAMIAGMLLDPEKPGWRRWDWKRGKAAEFHRINPKKNLVIEGSGALSRENRGLATFGVWIHLDQAERRRRKLRRDGTLNLEHWDRWSMQEQAFFARERPDELADVVVDGWTGRLTAPGE